ncbi:hypothetical protein HYH02_000800 [Chlamydomonas schloesseri]|uniref:Uncharacterized protein n=1 Tax=Chlamydomonas schloesseri TaxID=2026947 RepID=A0A836BDP4_9CHLO|nr:hypothetical protein HYH02_000800 [Chlamydomonas schloesseri]|eukprot:KAG2454974.1 hypothetical protein HYH02_000800 [Chlamydomonas schloesseri]
MFGFGRGGDDEVRKLRTREKELERELATAGQSLLSAQQRADSAEAKANVLATQNRQLALKVHRLALQRVELQNEKQRAEQDNNELRLQNLRLENEARVAKAAEADAWQVTKLKTALKQQAAQYESKLSSFKRRTKALLHAVLPGTHAARGLSMGGAGAPSSPTGQPYAGANARSAPGSPTADLSLPDLWDAPLSPPALPEGDEAAVAAGALLPAAASSDLAAEDVNGRVRDIIACLYDDTLSEDAALEQLTSLAAALPLAHLQAKQQASGTTTSAGCSPLPAGRGAGSGGASSKVDASTDALSHRGPRYMADAATETPADMPASYVGTGLHTPAEGGAGSPRLRLGGVVPPLDLAALVAQAMEAAPASHRSTTSTAAGAGAGGPSFNAFSQFVLAQPEKLQRLIMRHAAATGARPPLPTGSGLLAGGQSSTGGASTSGMPAFAGAASSASGLEGALPSNGSFTSRNSLTSRLLGLGAGSASSNNSNINRPPVAPSQPPAAAASSPARGGNTAQGVLLPSASINSSSMSSPPKAIKRSGSAGLPKFAPALDAAPAGVARGAPAAAPSLNLSGLSLLAPKGAGSGPAPAEMKPLRADVGGGGLGSTDLDAEFGGFFPSGSSSGALAVRR